MFGFFQPQSPSSLRFRPHVPCLLFGFLICSTVVRAAANVTVDDGDQRITYSPAGAWTRSAQSPLDSGGSHMLTQNSSATAVFGFTGTAIYFLSPLWPYNVTTAVSLDSSPPSLIDLVDHSTSSAGQGSETVPSQVVWSAAGLSNTQHTLRISVGSGERYAIVDGLIYTDPSASSTSSGGPTGRVVAPATSTTSPSSSRSKSVVPIALGTLFGILGVIIILIALWYFYRKRRRPVSEAWSAGGSTFSGSAGGGAAGGYANGHGHGYGYGAPSSYGYSQEQPAGGQWPQYPQDAYGAYGAPFPPPGMPTHPGVPPNRAPNRYQPGYTLSTITEKSTPQMLDGTRTVPGTPLSGAALGIGANSPASLQSELGYYTAPGSSIGHYSPAQGPAQLGQSSDSQPQQTQRQTMRSSSAPFQRGGSGHRK